MGKEKPFNIWCRDHWIPTCKKINLNLASCHSNNELKIDHRHKCKSYNYKSFSRKQEKLCDLGLGKKFLDRTPRTWSIRKKIINWTSIKPKTKKVCASKDTAKETKRQNTDWEKTFVRPVSDKELLSRIYKEHLQLNKKTNNPL